MAMLYANSIIEGFELVEGKPMTILDVPKRFRKKVKRILVANGFPELAEETKEETEA